MDKRFRVAIHRDQLTINLVISFVEEGLDKAFAYSFKEHKMIEAKDYRVPEDCSLRLNYDMVRLLQQGLNEHFGDYKTKDESKLEGQLEATKYHLEDMRKLMKIR